MYHTALDVAKRKFSPEFMNRIDKVVVFRTLNQQHLRQVLDIELNEVQNRIMASQSDKQFIFRCTAEAKEFLLREGTDLKYGARHLKRAIERHLVYPISNLIATGQIGLGDVIKIDLGQSGDKLTFLQGARSFQLFGVGSGCGFGFPGAPGVRPGRGSSWSRAKLPAAIDANRLRVRSTIMDRHHFDGGLFGFNG